VQTTQLPITTPGKLTILPADWIQGHQEPDLDQVTTGTWSDSSLVTTVQQHLQDEQLPFASPVINSLSAQLVG